MLVQRLSRWPNIEPASATSEQVFDGKTAAFISQQTQNIV